MRRMSLVLACLTVLSATYPASCLDAQEGDASAMGLLMEASASYANFEGLCADFHQRLEVTLLRRTHEGVGQLCQRAPNLFSMRFDEPDGDAIVVDGESMWMYTPSTDASQVIQFVAHSAEGRFNFHRTFLHDPAERFHASDEGTGEIMGRTARIVRVVPRDDTGFVAARLWIDPETLLLVRVAIEDANESIRTITLSNQRLDPDLPDSFFQFTPPPGATVLKR